VTVKSLASHVTSTHARAERPGDEKIIESLCPISLAGKITIKLFPWANLISPWFEEVHQRETFSLKFPPKGQKKRVDFKTVGRMSKRLRDFSLESWIRTLDRLLVSWRRCHRAGSKTQKCLLP